MGLVLLPILILEIVTLPITFPFRFIGAFFGEIGDDGFDFKRLFKF